ncbi:hypothetical protein GIB67_002912 [Kingdonia uniflora]|uniref:Protein kinase domain-containing protein n=1 Tax=Kingdonia uniflora TaxID=39325 RepID=A0A7J7MBE1_9MAGN|nr:hypothetical protein GIB67_002912 [Kingdonia uniflora]
MLYILLSGVPPFWAESEHGIFNAILRGHVDFTGVPWPQFLLLEKLKKDKDALIVKLDMCEKEKHAAVGKLKLIETELDKLILDLTFTKQKLEVFLHGAKNFDKMLSMSKNGTNKRGLGFDEQNAKSTPQITKFVKATLVPYLPKQSVTNAPHRQTKQFFIFHVFYCEVCGRKGHLAPYYRYVPQFRGRNNLQLEKGKPH